MFGKLVHKYLRDITADTKHCLQRSLGCVLYELMFLSKAFPRGQRGNPALPTNISSFYSGLFSAILSKYFTFSSYILTKICNNIQLVIYNSEYDH